MKLHFDPNQQFQLDAIAWAFFQKYDRRDGRFYDAISSRIIDEEVIVEKDWL